MENDSLIDDSTKERLIQFNNNADSFEDYIDRNTTTKNDANKKLYFLLHFFSFISEIEFVKLYFAFFLNRLFTIIR